MFDSRSIATNVAGWTGLGVTFPKELTEAVEVFETLTYTEVSYPVVFDIDGVTADNAEQKIRDFADELVMAETAGGLSPLENAKKIAVEVAARRVNAQARVVIPDLIEQLTPEFDQHAQAYLDAVAQLPGEVTAASLVEAGVEALTAYGDALRAAQYLNRIGSWVFETSCLSGFLQKEVDTVLRILRPTSNLELMELDRAARKPTDPTLAAINPVFFTAARLGVEFGINTLSEAATMRDELSNATTAWA